MNEVLQAVAEAYDDCIGVAKDFTGQGALVCDLLVKHKQKALAQLSQEVLSGPGG